VGDRTGLEMIRTLQDRGVQLGIDVYMECTITRLLKDGDRLAGHSVTGANKADSWCFEQSRLFWPPAVWQGVENYLEFLEYTGDGMALAYDAGPN